MTLKTKKFIGNDIASKLNENFSGLTLDILKNHLRNKDRDPCGRRHSDKAKKFALTLHTSILQSL